jgi:hypothetical protein
MGVKMKKNEKKMHFAIQKKHIFFIAFFFGYSFGFAFQR